MEFSNRIESRTSKLNGRFLLYISMFFLLYPDINFGADNFFTAKPLSIWFCFVFIILNIGRVVNKIRINELVFVGCLLISLVTGFALSTGENGISRIINGYIGFFSIYLAVKIYTVSATNNDLKTLIKVMYKSYVVLIFVFGIPQVIYIYFWRSPAFEGLFETLLYRGYNYFLRIGIGGKLAFSFSEPSLASLYFYTFYLPAHWLCKKYKLYSEKYLNIIFFIMLGMNTLTLSARWFIDTLVVFVIVIVFNVRIWKIERKRLIRLSIFVLGALIVAVVVIKNVVPEEVVRNLIYRFAVIFNTANKGTGKLDQSTSVRLILIYVAIKGFFSSPVLGLGSGNYVNALREYVVLPSEELARTELEYMMNTPDSSSYSFYFTSLCESGLLGVVMIAVLIKTLRFPQEKIFKNLSVIIIFMLLQNELYGSLPIALWLAVINSGCILVKGLRLNEDINSNTM